MIFRLATAQDVPALLSLAAMAKQTDTPPADVVFLAEHEALPVAAVGLELNREDSVVVSGGIIRPDFYRNRDVVRGLIDCYERWLTERGCKAYLFSITRRNRRMQRWMERLGATRYAKDGNRLWYFRVLGEPNVQEEHQRPAAGAY